MLREAGVRVGGWPEGVIALLQRLAKEPVRRVWLPGREEGFRRAGEREIRKAKQPRNKGRQNHTPMSREGQEEASGGRSRPVQNYAEIDRQIRQYPPPLPPERLSTRGARIQASEKQNKCFCIRSHALSALSPSKLLHGQQRFPGERQGPSSTDHRLNR